MTGVDMIMEIGEDAIEDMPGFGELYSLVTMEFDIIYLAHKYENAPQNKIVQRKFYEEFAGTLTGILWDVFPPTGMIELTGKAMVVVFDWLGIEPEDVWGFDPEWLADLNGFMIHWTECFVLDEIPAEDSLKALISADTHARSDVNFMNRWVSYDDEGTMTCYMGVCSHIYIMPDWDEGD